MLSARFDIDTLVDDIKAEADANASEAFVEVSKRVAEAAAAAHPYQNRTGTLQARTVPGVTRGVLTGRSLETEVVGDTPYGEFLEERRSRQFAFLKPAFDRTLPDLERVVDDKLNGR